MVRFDGAVLLSQVGTPSTPASGENALYIKNDGKLYTLDSAGAEVLVGPTTATSFSMTGFRGTTTTQTVSHNTQTTVTLTGSNDHSVGSGLSIASSIVTATNAGVYDLNANVQLSPGTGAGRRRITIETWTGSDPGVGLATQRTYSECYGDGSAANTAHSCSTRVTLAASTKIRLVVFQTSAGSGSLTILNNFGYPPQLNIWRLN